MFEKAITLNYTEETHDKLMDLVAPNLRARPMNTSRSHAI